MECPRCFYLDRKMGIDRPSMPGWSLNDAVDHLLKNEFDLLRENGQRHALMEEYNIDAVPYKHKDLPVWRDDMYNYIGITALHKETNLELAGIIDDVWQGSDDKLYIVDYKATSTSKEISLEDEYKQGYKKQVEWYQWLFRQNGFEVSDTAYFVFANGIKGEGKFDGKLEFELEIIEHEGSDEWVEPTIYKMKECLDSDIIPEAGETCEYCKYREIASKVERKNESGRVSQDKLL